VDVLHKMVLPVGFLTTPRLGGLMIWAVDLDDDNFSALSGLMKKSIGSLIPPSIPMATTCLNSGATEEDARSHHAKTQVRRILAARTVAKSKSARDHAVRTSWKLFVVPQPMHPALVHGEEENRMDSATDNVTAAKSTFSAYVAPMAMAHIIIVPRDGRSSVAKQTDGQL
jgi:hypothetical protein